MTTEAKEGILPTTLDWAWRLHTNCHLRAGDVDIAFAELSAAGTVTLSQAAVLRTPTEPTAAFTEVAVLVPQDMQFDDDLKAALDRSAQVLVSTGRAREDELLPACVHVVEKRTEALTQTIEGLPDSAAIVVLAPLAMVDQPSTHEDEWICRLVEVVQSLSAPAVLGSRGVVLVCLRLGPFKPVNTELLNAHCAQVAMYASTQAVAAAACAELSLLKDGDLETARALLAPVQAHLLRSPSDARTRFLAVDELRRSGAALGIPILAGQLVDLPMLAGPETFRPDLSCASPPRMFMERMKEELEQRPPGPFVLFPEPMRIQLGRDEPCALQAAAIEALQFGATQGVRDEADITTWQLFTKFALDLSPHCPKGPTPQQIIAVLASALANSGNFQAARDTAEGALLLAGRSDDRTETRYAWLTMADVYLRAGSVVDALLAWNVAIFGASAESLPAAHAWRAEVLRLRLARDLGLRSLLAQRLEQIAGIQASSEYEPGSESLQLEGIRGHLRLYEMADLDVAENMSEIEDAIEVAAKAVKKQAELHGELFVSMVELAQLLRLAEQGGHAVAKASIGPQTLSKTISELPPEAQSLVLAIQKPTPTVDELLDTLRGTQTRYADDLVSDARWAALLARRVLGASEMTTRDRIVALECLTDQSLAPRTEDQREEATNASADLRELEEQLFASTSPPPDSFLGSLAEAKSRFSESAMGELLAFLVKLRTQGHLIVPPAYEVHMMALSVDGILNCATLTSEDESFVALPKEAFDVDRYAAWRGSFPYAYGNPSPEHGDVADDFAAFSESCEFLGMGDLPVSRDRTTIVCADPRLANIPPALWRGSTGPIGAERPVASVPSLRWLADIAERAPSTSTRRVAWFLPSSGDVMSPIAIVRTNLDPSLAAHGFEVQEGTDPPGGEHSARVVLVTGHGGLLTHSAFFRAVSGERGSTRLSEDALSQHFDGVECVVLFVCSGGRLDTELYTPRWAGLPRALLAAGVRCVVASPWPLSAPSTAVWARHFLEFSITEGQTVGKSVFHANVALRDEGRPPSEWLALNVYGDPLVRL